MSESLERAEILLRLLFGWDWFSGPTRDYDGRLRTTKALKEFSSLANKLVIMNALLLLYGYFAFLYPTFSSNIPEAYHYLIPAHPTWSTLIRTWLQAQLLVFGLGNIYDRLERIAWEDQSE